MSDSIPDAPEKLDLPEAAEIPSSSEDFQMSDPQKNPVPHAKGHFPAPDRNWFDDMCVLYVSYDRRRSLVHGLQCITAV